jgi:SNF2 family DNA or RNA helicase
MEQGTGKTWLTLADAERCFIGGKIDALLVIAPNGVHSNWVLREIPTHLEVDSVGYVWRGTPKTKKALAGLEALYKPSSKPVLRVLCVNIEAMNYESTREEVARFINTFKVMFVVDESTRIKNPDAKRTKHVIKAARQALARRILSGTPLTKGATDLYSQFDCLKEGLLGTTSYRAFMAEYAVLLKPDDPQMQAIMRKLGGKVRGVPQVIKRDENGIPMWKNMDKLSAMLAPHSYRVTKKDCLDLPEKVYKQVYFELTPEQRRVYEKLKEDYEYRDDTTSLSLQAIAARSKMKQVTSGFINVEGEPRLVDPKENPRMDAFKEAIQDIDGQFIVWAMFEQELLQIKTALDEAGFRSALYYGATKTEERERIIDDFQAGKLDVFIGHAAAAGIGITLTAAETALYYSCSYDNELRKQSEDRCHRIGTKNNVLYIDLIAEDTLDEEIQRSLSVKSALADYVIDGVKPT